MNVFKKGLKVRFGKVEFIIVGYWTHYIVLASTDENNDQVLIYTKNELQSLIDENKVVVVR